LGFFFALATLHRATEAGTSSLQWGFSEIRLFGDSIGQQKDPPARV